jgi:hypothetical protein
MLDNTESYLPQLPICPSYFPQSSKDGNNDRNPSSFYSLHYHCAQQIHALDVSKMQQFQHVKAGHLMMLQRLLEDSWGLQVDNEG